MLSLIQMQSTISRTHRANILLGTLLLGRDYLGKAWDRLFGPLITECADHATAVRGTLNQAAAATVALDQVIADAAKGDGIIDEEETAQIRRRLADLNRDLVTGTVRN